MPRKSVILLCNDPPCVITFIKRMSGITRGKSVHSIKTYSTATRGVVALQKRKGKPQAPLEKI
ncbi:MAG: hypothetical protein E3J41_06135 [Candidatus Cloacimonadota bacterium]|nr:MAG: hypothetical protein E3J41_06135 [Candidatus Cloacimonadota bacterium]